MLDICPDVQCPHQRVLRETLAEAIEVLEGFEFEVAPPPHTAPTRSEGREDVQVRSGFGWKIRNSKFEMNVWVEIPNS